MVFFENGKILQFETVKQLIFISFLAILLQNFCFLIQFWKPSSLCKNRYKTVKNRRRFQKCKTPKHQNFLRKISRNISRNKGGPNTFSPLSPYKNHAYLYNESFAQCTCKLFLVYQRFSNPSKKRVCLL